jgi:uncharacterized membrane protein SpoIIM required for sporulation
VRQAEFERRHGADWQRFEHWLQRRGLRPGAQRAVALRLGEDSQSQLPTAEVPARYRALCAQLALARERRYAPALVARLHALVQSGHHVLYGAQAGGSLRFADFLSAGFPRLFRQQWRAVLVAALLFFGPLLGLIAAIQIWPDLAGVIVEPQQLAQAEAMYAVDKERLGQLPASDAAGMFGHYVFNNARIGFQTFAGGVLLGLGSLFFLIFNGIVLGTVIGHLTAVGLGEQIWSFVAGHSALELTAIAISGAAGLKLGWALLAPGRRSRRRALVEEGRLALQLAAGAGLMFVAAAAVEAFWSPLTLFDPQPKYLVGVLGWVLLGAYLLRVGRRAG